MSRQAWLVVGLALLLRVGLFPFAENKHGDAPMRALIAERMVLDPASAARPSTYCQFGPLHTTLMRPFIALDRFAPRSSRILSLLAGIAVFFPFLALARRLARSFGPAGAVKQDPALAERRATIAAFALAVSPLHLQASTTASSEALYLLLWVVALERLLAALATGRLRWFALSGLFASLAAVTRYDAWIALPLLTGAAWLFARPGRRASLPGATAGGLAIFAATAATFPAAWLLWGKLAGGDPLFFAHYISSDHASLAASAGAQYGALLGRARQLGVWSLAFIAAMTLPGAVAVVVALVRRRRVLSPEAWIVLVAALGPPALYLARGLFFQSFEPLARFALVPGALLLPLGAAALPLERARAFRALTFASAAAFSVGVWLVATAGRARIWAGAESMGALTRLDGEDRALAAHLRSVRPPGARVMIEPLSFAEIGITHAAGIPWTDAVTLTITRAPRATARESLLATGAQLIVGYDRPGGWPARLADWPARGPRFGHWTVVDRTALGLASASRRPPR
jgi:4-amino-4-deoxy-L-arabinose transferase-like glycosyltransferase